MKTNQPELLEEAMKVIPLPKLKQLMTGGKINPFGQSILDRWAMNEPEKLQQMVESKMLTLYGRLIEQQRIEKDLLLANAHLRSQGYSNLDILQMNQIDGRL